MDFNALMGAADRLLVSTFSVTGGVTLWPERPSPRVIEALSDKPYERTDIPNGGRVSGADYSFTARDSDLAGLAMKDAVQVGGVTYVVKELQPDGLGVTRVMLSLYTPSGTVTTARRDTLL